jgi:exopolysaccharide biosynthesis polyprenyl glycosylphosphotransferase
VAHEIDTVVIASSAFAHDVLARLVAQLRQVDVDVHVSAGLFEVLTRRVLVREISGVPLISVKGVSMSAANAAAKRVFDVVIASLVILIGLPVWLALAAIIKATSPGPVFYKQKRIGKNGTPFMMLKFRSMVADADKQLEGLRKSNQASGPLFKMRDDPRVTRIGRWMRRLSIDEFPQLLNVVRGEMSLVGPRPPLPRETQYYTENDWRRLEVLPGMTGLWQVSGRSNLTFAEMVRLDVFYIENWSLSLDLVLMLRTLPAVLAARGAY